MLNLKNYNPRNLKVLVNTHINKIILFAKGIYYSFLNSLLKFKRILKSKVFGLELFILFVVLMTGTIFAFYNFFLAPPEDFPVGAIVKIEEGMALGEIADKLYENNVIKSPAFFAVMAKLLMSENQMMAGDYYFETECSSARVVWRTIRGVCGITPSKIRVIEGHTVYDIADTFSRHFENFDTVEFLRLAEKEEGYLFPDTYYFLPNVTPKDVIKTMKANFEERIKEISQEINESGRKLEDIVIMASILEKEARTLISKQKIAGILWKRIEIGMPLQVDAVFPYINGKNTYQLSLDDLKEESPYNTYTNKGLPIGPIANPSIYSLLAAVTPVESDYLFYLSDLAGRMYYAEDFEEHKRNKRLYMYNK